MKKRFRFLRTMGTLFKILGIAVAALSFLGGLFALVLSFSGGNFWSMLGFDAYTGALTGIAASFGLLIGGILSGVTFYGYGELIYVFIAIEENTFKTVQLLEGEKKTEE